MHWHRQHEQAFLDNFGPRLGRRAALMLAIAAATALASGSAAAQIRGGFGAGISGGGFGRGGGSYPGPVIGPPPRGDGPIWGGRPRYPGPVGFPVWVEPRPRYVEEIAISRPRPAEMPERRVEPKPRPAKKVVRQAASAEPAGTRPQRPRTPVAALQQHVPGEVVVELQRNAAPTAIGEIAREYGLASISAQPVALLDTTLHRLRIRDGRSVEAVVRSLAGDVRVASAQPNNIFRLQGDAAGAMVGLQYARAKLRLPEAHQLATGAGVTVAVIDSGVDVAHPEFEGAVAGRLDASGSAGKPDAHGTAIAGIIAARGKLVGAAPAARILAVQTFAADAKTGEARAVSTDVVRAISLAAEAGSRLANLSFAGPNDPLVSRAIAAAHGRGTIFVAAAGNGGPKAAPAFPAADPNVIGVTATDARDGIFPAANRGTYIAVAAPGVDVLAPAPGRAYKVSSGTSMAAAHVTGILALVLQKRPDLTSMDARHILSESTKDLGPAGPDADFGAGLVDARRVAERASDGAPTVAQVAVTIPASP